MLVINPLLSLYNFFIATLSVFAKMQIVDLIELKNKIIKDELKISNDFGRIFSFIDFANVNNWFSVDDKDSKNQTIGSDEFIEINLEGLKSFSDAFAERTKLYYGEDNQNNKSLGFTYLLRKLFNNKNIVTKKVQKIKHYLENDEKFIEIRKCNFDVEIAVDAYKMIEHYDTFCIFSGDADFIYLNKYLKKKGKKVIIIKSGYILNKYRQTADLVINAQDIKKYITHLKKQKPD